VGHHLSFESIAIMVSSFAVDYGNFPSMIGLIPISKKKGQEINKKLDSMPGCVPTDVHTRTSIQLRW